MKPAKAHSIKLEIEDNAHLPDLYGHHNSNLVQIEKALDVSLASFGNVLEITGSSDAVARARFTIETLVSRIVGGSGVSSSTVKDALRWAAQDGSPKKNGNAATATTTITTWGKPVMAKSAGQQDYIDALGSHDMVFGIGPAGSGKTYLAVAKAVEAIKARQVERIVLSRPAVEAGERLGFLPGDMKEKVDPYLRPLYDALYDMMPHDKVERMITSGRIEIAPIAFMRGRTLAQSYVIIDEAQNTTPVQMKMVLTRLGDDSRMVVTGDLTQIDLPDGKVSGLAHALGILENVEGVGVVRLKGGDVVRHPVVARIIKAYEAAENKT